LANEVVPFAKGTETESSTIATNSPISQRSRPLREGD